MEWLTAIKTAIDYMEAHLYHGADVQDVAKAVYLSPFLTSSAGFR